MVDALVDYEDQRVKCKIVFALDTQQIGNLVIFEVGRVHLLFNVYLNLP